jgi:hypothetical protein
MRNVYIETDHAEQILNPNLYAAFDGFSKKAYDVHLFYLNCPATSKEDIVCGTVSTVQRAWRALGVNLPELLDYPTQLAAYLGRKIWPSTLGLVRAQVFSGESSKVFVKPRLVHKLFTGQLIEKPRDLIATASLPDDTAIWVAEPIEFVSEYRMFVHDQELIGAKHYNGSFRVLPDFNMVDKAIADYKGAPISYSLDFGFASDGRTLLVEVNDGFALGNYGLDSFLYAQFIEARWDEVTAASTPPAPAALATE